MLDNERKREVTLWRKIENTAVCASGQACNIGLLQLLVIYWSVRISGKSKHLKISKQEDKYKDTFFWHRSPSCDYFSRDGKPKHIHRDKNIELKCKNKNKWKSPFKEKISKYAEFIHKKNYNKKLLLVELFTLCRSHESVSHTYKGIIV